MIEIQEYNDPKDVGWLVSGIALLVLMVFLLGYMIGRGMAQSEIVDLRNQLFKQDTEVEMMMDRQDKITDHLESRLSLNVSGE